MQRQWQHKEPIRTWMRMKLLMIERFLSDDLEHSLSKNQYHRPHEDLIATTGRLKSKLRNRILAMR